MIRELKTAQWMTPAEVIAELHLTGDAYHAFVDLVVEIDKKAQAIRPKLEPGVERPITLGTRTQAHTMTVASKTLPQVTGDQQSPQICLPKSELQWLRNKLGLDYNAAAIVTDGGKGR